MNFHNNTYIFILLYLSIILSVKNEGNKKTIEIK